MVLWSTRPLVRRWMRWRQTELVPKRWVCCRKRFAFTEVRVGVYLIFVTYHFPKVTCFCPMLTFENLVLYVLCTWTTLPTPPTFNPQKPQREEPLIRSETEYRVSARTVFVAACDCLISIHFGDHKHSTSALTECEIKCVIKAKRHDGMDSSLRRVVIVGNG